MSARPSRRAVLAGAAALPTMAAGGIPAVPGKPASELLATLAEIRAIDAVIDPLFDEYSRLPHWNPRHAELERAMEEPEARRRDLVARVTQFPARTMEELRGKAALLRAEWDMYQDGRPMLSDYREEVAWSLLQDLLAGGAA